jgi:hypothetical protein
MKSGEDPVVGLAVIIDETEGNEEDESGVEAAVFVEAFGEEFLEGAKPV